MFRTRSSRDKYRLIKQGFLFHRYIDKEDHCNIFEQRFNNIEEKDMTIEDLVYQFYRDKEKLLIRYKEMFKEFGYNEEFNWTNFLNEIGWGENKARWEYINYNDPGSRGKCNNHDFNPG